MTVPPNVGGSFSRTVAVANVFSSVSVRLAARWPPHTATTATRRPAGSIATAK
jgi:hypothetical protein